MKIHCDCKKFTAELTHFPEHSPGRLSCYCDDCQAYLRKIKREDLMDPYGGTEIIPVYPSEFKILQGRELLRCNVLSENGLNRWSTICCNTPVANTKPNFPWVGIIHQMFNNHDPSILESLGPIKSRIMGKYATNNPPFEIPEKLKIKDALVVLPFILKGLLFKKSKGTPFYQEDQVTPISNPVLLK